MRKRKTAMKATEKSNRLVMNCVREVSGVPKFSAVISTIAAAATSPTTVGRSAPKTLFSKGLSLCLSRKRLTSIITMKGSQRIEMVARSEPKQAIAGG